MSIIMLMAMAAGAVAMPMPSGSPDRWLKIGDIPKAASRPVTTGAFFFKALVAPDGKGRTVQRAGIERAQGRLGRFLRACEAALRVRRSHRSAGRASYYVLEENTPIFCRRRGCVMARRHGPT